MKKTFPASILISAILILGGLAFAQDQPKAPASAPAQSSRAAEIVFSGKTYSPRKQPVTMPFATTLNEVKVKIGQKVKFGETLAMYDNPPGTRAQDKTTLTSQTRIKELEAQLADLNTASYKAEQKKKELQFLEKENMATSQSLVNLSHESGSIDKKRALLQLQLTQAKDNYKESVEGIKARYGLDKLKAEDLPWHCPIGSPMDGYVMWISPEARPGTFLAVNTSLFQVGTMDPLIIRTMVHEIEAQKLSVGDSGKVVFESIPGREFTATVSSIPWAPVPATLQQPSYYEVELTIPNPDLVLKEGLKGEITIVPKK